MGFRMSMVIGLPCAVGMIVMAEPILLLLYPTQKASAISAAPCMQILAVGFICLAILLTMTGGLQGIGKQMIPVRNLFIGVCIKLVITWTLTAIPSINVLGAAVGTVCAYAFAAITDTLSLKKYTGVKIKTSLIFVKPLISSVTMGVVAWVAYKLLYHLLGSNAIAAIVAVLLAVVVYAVMIIKTKAITRDELVGMPKGTKIVKICDKLRLW
jgi:stage V sporulation protein B